MQFVLNAETNVLHDGQGRVFDRMARRWRRAPPAATGGAVVTSQEACRWLQGQADYPVRAPISMIGPREATAAQLETAEALGAGIAGMGLAVLCGGLAGVMTAAAKGAKAAGGQVIGLLPDADWREANPYVTVSLASGVGLARNAIIAEAGLCLAAVGGGHGTLSEMAYGLQFGRKVFALENAPKVDGAIYLESVDAALDAIANVALNTDGAEPPWR